MKRMVCIGAQSIAVAEIVVPPPGLEMQCRRDDGPVQLRTYFCTHPIEPPTTLQVQLSLFEG